jgi:hypothetical protein
VSVIFCDCIGLYIADSIFESWLKMSLSQRELASHIFRGVSVHFIITRTIQTDTQAYVSSRDTRRNSQVLHPELLTANGHCFGLQQILLELIKGWRPMADFRVI